jgi:hypothetical protein
MHLDDEPAAVSKGVTKGGVLDHLIRDEPPVQFEFIDELKGDCATVVVWVDERDDDQEQAGEPELQDNCSLQLPESACRLGAIVVPGMDKISRQL